MNDVQIDRILRLKEITFLSSLSSVTIYKKIDRRTFPRWVWIDERRKGWRQSDFERWLADPQAFRS